MTRNWLIYFAVLIASISVLAYLFVVLGTTRRADPFADIKQFSGCYFYENLPPIQLRGDGRVAFQSRIVGTYSIRKPVGGKYGYLLELSGTGFAQTDKRELLVPNGRGQILDITREGEIFVSVAGKESKLDKRDCSVASGSR